ncbi:MAG TPA: tRNA lysidine(34) synthetase TilS [Caldisericia bacterium]|nr:tRNA lysidine(34) synthetase TilS [Caldisericia bacterium]HPF49553.1 tRNA lysidine(34) synthetase TilS [Caldisericia bacterium]HPI84153.1 tRNA lysidine(34) synthetase TilS [Caldisericia bacterium]HPQ93552.1 tRNA lysidine(34) synthetase TilS [Caldisericia bacterium]HRV75442.1 tRNA lysidine(34) synthetase TilS [Caldisericia bacterium]
MKPRACEQRVVEFIRQNRMFDEKDVVVLVACSGGADSLTLLHILNKVSGIFGFSIHVAHINHNLREGSGSDCDFVKSQASKLDIPFHSLSVRITNFNGTLEERARLIRHCALRWMAKKIGANYIALGHTSSDRAETVLHNLARGAGPAGIGTMPAKDGMIIRPVLFLQRREVENYLEAIGESYITDETNSHIEFSRNRIRHKIIPELEKIFEGASASIARYAEISRQESDFLNNYANQRLSECVRLLDDKLEIDGRYFRKHELSIRRRMMRLIMKNSETLTLTNVDRALEFMSSCSRGSRAEIGSFEFVCGSDGNVTVSSLRKS